MQPLSLPATHQALGTVRHIIYAAQWLPTTCGEGSINTHLTGSKLRYLGLEPRPIDDKSLLELKIRTL